MLKKPIAITNTLTICVSTYRVRELDPFLAPNLPVYLSCLVEMNKKSELFHTAHQVCALPVLASFGCPVCTLD